MDIKNILFILTPVLAPLIKTGLAFLFAFIGKELYAVLSKSKIKSIAATIVMAVEDAHNELDGSGKLKLAIDKVADKAHIDRSLAEDFVREAYINFVRPLDALKNPTASGSIPS